MKENERNLQIAESIYAIRMEWPDVPRGGLCGLA